MSAAAPDDGGSRPPEQLNRNLDELLQELRDAGRRADPDGQLP